MNGDKVEQAEGPEYEPPLLTCVEHLRLWSVFSTYASVSLQEVYENL